MLIIAGIRTRGVGDNKLESLQRTMPTLLRVVIRRSGSAFHRIPMVFFLAASEAALKACSNAATIFTSGLHCLRLVFRLFFIAFLLLLLRQIY